MSASQHEHHLRRIIKSNNRLSQFKAMRAPDNILRNERRVLRDAIQALRQTQIGASSLIGKVHLSPQAA
tara:strand:+ start:397 stop:603 length:207 start_codon:yes stop_codon:yes gene_type:complete